MVVIVLVPVVFSEKLEFRMICQLATCDDPRPCIGLSPCTCIIPSAKEGQLVHPVCAIGRWKLGGQFVEKLLSRSDLVVRRCWNQWRKDTSFRRRPGSGRPRQTSRREARPIMRHARIEPTASLATV
ncbi:hypothetical protein TNCV_2995941 [Trichonephila clavipes]|nr:hypothetical protein TNCV_2995941 [Trichonephila clavipes]